MKYLVILTLALFALVAAEEWEPDHAMSQKEVHEICAKESGLTEEQLEKIKAMERPDEKEVHDYILCSVKKLQIFTDEDGFKTDRLMLVFTKFGLDKDKCQEILTKCVDNNEEKSTLAVRAYRGVECMMQNNIDKLLKEAQENAIKKNE